VKRDCTHQRGAWKPAHAARSAGEILALVAVLLSAIVAIFVFGITDLSMSLREQVVLLFVRPDGHINLVSVVALGVVLAIAAGLALVVRSRDETRVHARRLAEEVGGSRAAVERLSSALAARDEQLLTVVHELRAPLTYIVGYAELLSSSQRPRPAHEISEMSTAIQTASATMLRLMDDLTAATRQHEPGFTLQTRPVDLAPVMRGIVAGYGVHSDTHRFSLQLPDDKLTVRADPERIHQVLANLLTNAITYSPSGGEIAVRVRPLGDYVRVEVTDHGIGMAPADQERAFDRFYRGGDARKLRTEGSGLGLAIVRDLVEAHGGHVGVVSRVGQGSTFWFTLQASDEYATAPAAARPVPQRAPAI